MAAALHPDLNNPRNYQQGTGSPSTRMQNQGKMDSLSLLL